MGKDKGNYLWEDGREVGGQQLVPAFSLYPLSYNLLYPLLLPFPHPKKKKKLKKRRLKIGKSREN